MYFLTSRYVPKGLLRTNRSIQEVLIQEEYSFLTLDLCMEKKSVHLEPSFLPSLSVSVVSLIFSVPNAQICLKYISFFACPFLFLFLCQRLQGKPFPGMLCAFSPPRLPL